MRLGSGKNISYQQSLSVSNSFRNFVQSLVSKRNSYIFCLTTIYTTAKSPSAILICTVIYITFFTEKTFTTKGFYIYSHTIPWFYMSYSTSN